EVPDDDLSASLHATGAFLTDGTVHWVPEHERDSTSGLYEPKIKTKLDWGKPTKAPARAKVKDMYTLGSKHFVVLEIEDANGDRVDGRTHIFGTTTENT